MKMADLTDMTLENFKALVV